MSLAATARAAACSTSADAARRLVVRNRAAMLLVATVRVAWKRGGHDILPRMPRETLSKPCLNNLLFSSISEADLAAISRGTSEREDTDEAVFS